MAGMYYLVAISCADDIPAKQFRPFSISLDYHFKNNNSELAVRFIVVVFFCKSCIF
jgi:hypothetical protein